MWLLILIVKSKTLEAYGEHIEQGRVPVFRGVALTADDKLRRAVITQLICHFEQNFLPLSNNIRLILLTICL